MPILESTTPAVITGVKIFSDLLANKDALNNALSDYLATIPTQAIVNYHTVTYSDPLGPAVVVTVNWG